MKNLKTEAIELGHKSAKSAANKMGEAWQVKAVYMIQVFAKTIKRPFIAKEAREWAENAGLEMPKERRAWGGAMIRAKKLNVIYVVGQNHPMHTHGVPVSLWLEKK